MRVYLALAAILALIGAYWLGDHNGVSREHDRNVAAASVQKDKVAVKVDEQAQASSEARTTMLDYLASIPAIEVKANEAAERVRIIYRDRAAKAELGACPAFTDRPQRVRDELDAAYGATLAAIGAMRRTTADGAAHGP
jgi:hypothetical protein